jgi:hypothetical protein
VGNLAGHPVAEYLLAGRVASHLAGNATGDGNKDRARPARNDRRLLNGSDTVGLSILSERIL